MRDDLHRAAEAGSREGVEAALADGADINAYDDDGKTPLHRAVASPRAGASMVSCLLEKGADWRLPRKVSFPDGAYYEQHALAFAVSHLSLEKVEAFLAAGADLRYVREGGYDALIDAACSYSTLPFSDPPQAARLEALLGFLLDKGLPLTGRTRKRGQSALLVLSSQLQLGAMRLLVAAGADEGELRWTPLHKAVAYGTTGEAAAALDSAPLDAQDHEGRTALILAAQLGDLQKVELLWKRGADRKAQWRGGGLLELSITRKDQGLLEWLIAHGADVNEPGRHRPPLGCAIIFDNRPAVKALLAAGADVHWRSEHGFTALHDAHDRETIELLLEAGADTRDLSHEGRRAVLGLPAEPDLALLAATPEEFARAKHPRAGRRNPEEADEPFWLAMIRSGVNAYQAKKKYGEPDSSPVWCAQRFGQTLTPMPDGRIILIGGEHEDYYDDDFHIYNDVFVFEPEGKCRVFLYPEDAFPPTDGHSATLVGDWIYVIGNVGYRERRRAGFTPVYRLDAKTLRVEAVVTSGECPGWIARHRAVLKGSEIEVTGGETHVAPDAKLEPNHRAFRLDLRTLAWRPIARA